MSKRDYEKAASIAQDYMKLGITAPRDAFIALFEQDNPLFDRSRFVAACIPGANVKARPRKVVA